SDEIIAKSVPSHVSKQPIGDEETRLGAINRAKHVFPKDKKANAIGLEGGVIEVDGILYLCNWGALMEEEHKLYTAAGARIELPSTFKQALYKGTELSELMDVYTKTNDIRNHAGAIGIFTNDLIDRSSMFIHVVTLLKGQLEYWSNLI